MQIQTVAVGWQVYDITRDPLDLGLVGLSQFLPSLLLVLVYGRRRRPLPAAHHHGASASIVEALCAVALLAFTMTGMVEVWPIFALLVGFGIARAFYNPAQQSLVPNLVPAAILGSAIALNTLSWQIASIIGPVMGGLLYGISPEAAYGTAAVLLVISADPDPRSAAAAAEDHAGAWLRGRRYVAGIKYIWHERSSSARSRSTSSRCCSAAPTRSCPSIARDILDVGPWGLGPASRRSRRSARWRSRSTSPPIRSATMPAS